MGFSTWDPWEQGAGGGGWPANADYQAKLATVFPAGIPAEVTADLDALGLAVIAEFQSPPGLAPDSGGTGRLFTPTVLTRLYTGTGRAFLRVAEFIPPSQGGTALTILADGVAVTGVTGDESGKAEPPWDTLVLGSGASISRWPVTAYDNVSITATWGWSAVIPQDVWEAVRCGVALRAIKAAMGFTPISAWHDADRNITYGETIPKLYEDLWQGEYNRCVARYRDEAQVMAKLTTGLPGFGRGLR